MKTLEHTKRAMVAASGYRVKRIDMNLRFNPAHRCFRLSCSCSFWKLVFTLIGHMVEWWVKIAATTLGLEALWSESRDKTHSRSTIDTMIRTNLHYLECGDLVAVLYTARGRSSLRRTGAIHEPLPSAFGRGQCKKPSSTVDYVEMGRIADF